MSKILVLGATGHVGRPLVKELVARGEAVKAASRTGQPVEGAEGVAFDIMKPDFDTLFAGVDRMFLMLPTGYADSKGLLLPIVKAAAARNMKIVFHERLSASNADDSIPYRQVEIAIEKSGVPLRDPAAQLVRRQFPTPSPAYPAGPRCAAAGSREIGKHGRDRARPGRAVQTCGRGRFSNPASCRAPTG